MEPPI